MTSLKTLQGFFFKSKVIEGPSLQSKDDMVAKECARVLPDHCTKEKKEVKYERKDKQKSRMAPKETKEEESEIKLTS